MKFNALMTMATIQADSDEDDEEEVQEQEDAPAEEDAAVAPFHTIENEAVVHKLSTIYEELSHRDMISSLAASMFCAMVKPALSQTPRLLPLSHNRRPKLLMRTSRSWMEFLVRPRRRSLDSEYLGNCK
jgi:hypothetical protein